MKVSFKKLKEIFALKNHTHSYNDLQNKPTIPDVSGKADSSDFDTIEATITYTDGSPDETVEIYIVPDNL